MYPSPNGKALTYILVVDVFDVVVIIVVVVIVVFILVAVEGLKRLRDQGCRGGHWLGFG
jgi:uncharacterized membrane protein